MREMNMAQEQGMGWQWGGRCGEVTAVLGNGGTVLASCKGYEPSRVFNKSTERQRTDQRAPHGGLQL